MNNVNNQLNLLDRVILANISVVVWGLLLTVFSDPLVRVFGFPKGFWFLASFSIPIWVFTFYVSKKFIRCHDWREKE